MSLIFQTVTVNVGKGADGQLVHQDARLVAVLVRLSSLHGRQAGGWFLEAGFGPLATRNPPVFDDLDAAAEWIEARLADHEANGLAA